MEPWIQTLKGGAFSLVDFQRNRYDLEEIAHSLSMICRFNGHCLEFFSVAEHSVHVWNLVRKETDDPKIHRAALLHDAAEAYLGDIAQPLKLAMNSAWYQRATDTINTFIRHRFDTGPLHDALIVRADLVMLATEKAQLMEPEPQSWGNLPDPAPINLEFWSPKMAGSEFIRAAKFIGMYP